MGEEWNVKSYHSGTPPSPLRPKCSLALGSRRKEFVLQPRLEQGFEVLRCDCTAICLPSHPLSFVPQAERNTGVVITAEAAAKGDSKSISKKGNLPAKKPVCPSLPAQSPTT